jgi:uncharacterized protein involved in type VI secretion and phage assembly
MHERGVVMGIVRELEDPDGQGRVRVEYPHLPGRPRSPWISIAAPLAGKQTGAWFMPEKDDEVLVAYAQGRFDVPVVVGFLWNGVQRPPETNRHHRVIVTPGGNELRFEDEDNKLRVLLRTKNGHLLELSEPDKKVVLKSQGGLSVTLDDGGPKIEVSGGGRKIELANGKVAIT